MTQPAYLDTNLSVAERVQDLLSRLTLDEKVGMMNHPAQGVPRLGIPDYNFWSEALHGVAANGRATVFPQVSCPRPQRGSRKMLTFGDQKFSPWNWSLRPLRRKAS